MKPLNLILIILVVFFFQDCIITFPQSYRQNFIPREYIKVPHFLDSVIVSPSTKYFYSFKFGHISNWNITSEWILGNLSHFGISVNEAWYYEGSSHRHIGEDAVGKTMVSPTFIVGLTEQNFEILQHHFKPIEHFNPLTKPNGSHSRYIHFVPKQNSNTEK
ncbi:MAG: hypothetical protein AAB071_00190 [Bacteroidota bacterium]